MLRIKQRARWKRLIVELHFLGTHAKTQSGVHRIHHVQVVSPGFRPVFPRVHGGVGADVMLLPVERRTLLIMLLKSLGVAGTLVAEQAAERFQPGTVGDQSVPVVMPCLVPKVTE